MFEIIFLIVTGVYFILLAFISAGLSRKFSRQFSYNPFVTVIVAARNEEVNILECMESLFRQSYNKDKYEVIIADDFSTDNTGKIIDNFITGKNNFRKIIPDTDTNLRGKMNALNSAVKCASGEVILFTDADCIMPESWIENIVGYYNNKTAMVNGFSTADADNIISGIQSIDLVFLISVAAGMSNNGMPVSCIGNNMSVKRSALDETGGYSTYNNSVTEDYILLKAVKSLKKYDIILPVDNSSVVKTKPLKSISEIFNQKKRWAKGGLAAPDISLLLMITSYLTNLMILLSFIFLTSTVFTIILFKIFSDFFFLYQVHSRLKLLHNMKYFIFFETYYILYTTILPVILLFSRSINWKDRKY